MADGRATPEKAYDFFTPLALSEENHQKALANGFPKDIQVYYVDQALEIAEKGFRHRGKR